MVWMWCGEVGLVLMRWCSCMICMFRLWLLMLWLLLWVRVSSFLWFSGWLGWLVSVCSRLSLMVLIFIVCLLCFSWCWLGWRVKGLKCIVFLLVGLRWVLSCCW